jgi:hypothetical protein
MEDYEIYEKIDAYLKGEMTAEAAQTFAQDISQNADLAEQVALHRLEFDAMEVLVENNLRSKMATWNTSEKRVGGDLSDANSTQPKSDTPSVSTVVKPLMTVQKGGLFTRYVWAAAASVAVLVTFAFWSFNRPERTIDNMTKTEQLQNKPVSPNDSLDELDGAAAPLPDSSAQSLENQKVKKDSVYSNRDSLIKK